MILEEMLLRVRGRTRKSNDDSYLLTELNSAKDWAWHRAFVLNKDLLITYDERITPSTSVSTRDYDLAANVAAGNTLVAIKQMYMRFSNETDFTPVRFTDSTDPLFSYYDRASPVATNHPILVDIRNFDMIRFAPPLPISAVIRIDYIRRPPDFSLDTNAALENGDDIPEPMHEAICDKATAQVYMTLDDDRAGWWEQQAERKLNSALHLVRDRQFQNPERIKPFRRGVRRWL